MKKWRPLGKRVLIEKITKDKTEGGLFIPNSERQRLGKVIAVGSKVKPELHLIGKKVHYGNYAELELDGTVYVLCHLSEVLVIEND